MTEGAYVFFGCCVCVSRVRGAEESNVSAQCLRIIASPDKSNFDILFAFCCRNIVTICKYLNCTTFMCAHWRRVVDVGAWFLLVLYLCRVLVANVCLFHRLYIVDIRIAYISSMQ